MSKVEEWTDLFDSWEETEEQAQVEVQKQAQVEVQKKAQAETMRIGRWYVYNIKRSNKVDYETYKIYETYAKKENITNFEKIQSKGVVVFIEPTATMFLIGSEMDYSKDKLSSRFVFKNPNEKSTCGCGESFSI